MRDEINGKSVTCSRCAGAGATAAWDGPIECPDCDGSGHIWRYESGLFARYYAGPLLGREPTKKEKPDAV